MLAITHASTLGLKLERSRGLGVQDFRIEFGDLGLGADANHKP